ncbi:glycosyltransferase [Mesorhizobium cantuariense]|uniref:Glycosyltransferase n=1 Tax=Mesorhizobium cantuariense TaxID=1300275 RepID=A0ABV7MHZ3_9HYPH
MARNTTIARNVLAQPNFHFLQAPIYQAKPQTLPPTNSYADILLASGYDGADELDGLLRSWITTLSLYKPDLLIADHAPTALLAARALGIRAMLVGTGFEIPPAFDPFPSLIHWRQANPDHLLQSQNRALAAVNQVLSRRGIAALPSLSSLFATTPRLISSIKELDPYGVRPDVRYIGAIDSPQSGKREKWVSKSDSKVFAYLHDGLEQLLPLIDGLRRADVEAICVFPGVPKGELPPSGANVKIYNDMLDLENLLPETSLCISNGGNGLAGKCLAQGIPMLLMPIYLEQFITADRIVKLGAGMVVSGPQTTEQYSSIIRAALKAPGIKSSAMKIMQATANPDSAGELYLATVEALLASRG